MLFLLEIKHYTLFTQEENKNEIPTLLMEQHGLTAQPFQGDLRQLTNKQKKLKGVFRYHLAYLIFYLLGENIQSSLITFIMTYFLFAIFGMNNTNGSLSKSLMLSSTVLIIGILSSFLYWFLWKKFGMQDRADAYRENQQNKGNWKKKLKKFIGYALGIYTVSSNLLIERDNLRKIIATQPIGRYTGLKKDTKGIKDGKYLNGDSQLIAHLIEPSTCCLNMNLTFSLYMLIHIPTSIIGLIYNILVLITTAFFFTSFISYFLTGNIMMANNIALRMSIWILNGFHIIFFGISSGKSLCGIISNCKNLDSVDGNQEGFKVLNFDELDSNGQGEDVVLSPFKPYDVTMNKTQVTILTIADLTMDLMKLTPPILYTLGIMKDINTILSCMIPAGDGMKYIYGWYKQKQRAVNLFSHEKPPKGQKPAPFASGKKPRRAIIGVDTNDSGKVNNKMADEIPRGYSLFRFAWCLPKLKCPSFLKCRRKKRGPQEKARRQNEGEGAGGL